MNKNFNLKHTLYKFDLTIPEQEGKYTYPKTKKDCE